MSVNWCNNDCISWCSHWVNPACSRVLEVPMHERTRVVKQSQWYRVTERAPSNQALLGNAPTWKKARIGGKLIRQDRRREDNVCCTRGGTCPFSAPRALSRESSKTAVSHPHTGTHQAKSQQDHPGTVPRATTSALSLPILAELDKPTPTQMPRHRSRGGTPSPCPLSQKQPLKSGQTRGSFVAASTFRRRRPLHPEFPGGGAQTLSTQAPRMHMPTPSHPPRCRPRPLANKVVASHRHGGTSRADRLVTPCPTVCSHTSKSGRCSWV